MDMIEMQPIIEMGLSLTELAVKGTASKISNRIKASKNEKNIENLRTMYDEIINEVLQEREEAIRIAQTYKSELDKILISDDDIEHLQTTVAKVLDIIKAISPNTPIESFETIKSLISVDTLKTLQLLGFNYKVAIGEPLTALCANAINNWGNKKSPSNNNSKRK